MHGPLNVNFLTLLYKIIIIIIIIIINLTMLSNANIL